MRGLLACKDDNLINRNFKTPIIVTQRTTIEVVEISTCLAFGIMLEEGVGSSHKKAKNRGKCTKLLVRDISSQNIQH